MTIASLRSAIRRSAETIYRDCLADGGFDHLTSRALWRECVRMAIREMRDSE